MKSLLTPEEKKILPLKQGEAWTADQIDVALATAYRLFLLGKQIRLISHKTGISVYAIRTHCTNKMFA